MLVPAEHYHRAKDLLQQHKESTGLMLWSRCAVVTESTLDLVKESLGTMWKRHDAAELVSDESKGSVEVQLLGNVETLSLTLDKAPVLDFLPPRLRSKGEVPNSTEAGSHYVNPRCAQVQWEIFTTSSGPAASGC